MVITDINPQKKKGRYNIYVDGEFYSGIDAFSLAQAGYKVGQEVSKEELEQKVKESEVRSAFDKLAGYLSSPKSKKEAEDKLLKVGYSKDVVKKAIEKAEEYGYICDKQYAKMLVDSKSLKSKKALEADLYKKGISKEDKAEALKDIDSEVETARALLIAQKYLKNKPLGKKTSAMLYAYLMNKGFCSDAVSNVTQKYKSEEDDDWD